MACEPESQSVIPPKPKGIIVPPPRVQTTPSATLPSALGSDPAAALLSQRNYKRDLCHNFQAGFCVNGLNCTFAHGEHELRNNLPWTADVAAARGQVGMH